MIICFIGAPGSGKSTQANLLANKLGMNVYSLGDLIRGARNNQNIYDISNKLFQDIIKSFEHKDILLDDDLIFRAINELITIINSNLIIDGFPRSKEQINYMYNHLINRNDFKLINIAISKELSENRVLTRNRDDNKYIDQKRRIDLYFKNIPPHLNSFISFSGDESIELIHNKIYHYIS